MLKRKYFIDTEKVINSANNKGFTLEEKQHGSAILEKVYRKGKTELACICFALSDGYVYKIYMPIERLTAQCRKQKATSKHWGSYYFACPLSKAQCEEVAKNGKAKKLGTFEYLEDICKKYGFGNGGQGIEKMLSKIEHKTFNYTLPAHLGAEYDNSEVKFYNMKTGSGAKGHCPNLP